MNPNQNQSDMDSAGVLNYFTRTAILEQIGARRLAKLFGPFDADLKDRNLTLIDPGAQKPRTGRPVACPENPNYFSDLAALLARTESLPENLRELLFTLEEAAKAGKRKTHLVRDRAPPPRR